MIKILKTDKPYKHEIGSVLYGFEYLENLNVSELENKKYCYFVVKKTNEFNEQFMNIFGYECPFIKGNKYLWFSPSYLFTNESHKNDPWHAFQKNKKDKKMYGFFSDKIEEIKEFDEYKNPETFYGENLFMGHGYTFFALPSDGSNSKDVAVIKLDNGDIMVGKVWIWFNK